MPEIEVNLRFRVVDGGVVKGLLEYIDELREKSEVSAVSIHVRYVEG